jgi:hypothetical protein
MLHVFWLVLVDLWHFLLGFETVEKHALSARPMYSELPSKIEPVPLPHAETPLALVKADMPLIAKTPEA